ncbi:MAG: peptidylprolyl isomerase [Bryobacteraceae bacterium]
MTKRLLGLLLLAACGHVFAQNIRIRTTMGDIDVTLLPDSAPLTVQNFLNYANKGAYNNSFFHRSVSNFVVQGGGFKWADGTSMPIPEDPPVKNEYRLSNVRGTLAMAKLGTGPDTATNQWFFNLGDNSANLNNQNGGFTVFARVANNASLAIMDRLARVPTYDLGSPFDQIPLDGYTAGSTVAESNLLRVLSITTLESPSISLNGVQTASAFGGFSYGSPGSYIEIYGGNLSGGESRAWADTDFRNGGAPRTLEGVSVTVNGVPGYVAFISPGQVNVQIPEGVPTGGPVTVAVLYRGTTSERVQFEIREFAPGLLAPASFKAGERQYVAAVHANGSFAANGQFANLPAAPAAPGETLVFYGTGFGPVAPITIPVAGQVATGATRIRAPVEFRIGDAVAEVSYAGFVPGLVGVYQFNVKVPDATPTGDAPVRVTVGGQASEQTLVLPVQR